MKLSRSIETLTQLKPEVLKGKFHHRDTEDTEKTLNYKYISPESRHQGACRGGSVRPPGKLKECLVN
jgi:hypothetical protein